MDTGTACPWGLQYILLSDTTKLPTVKSLLHTVHLMQWRWSTLLSKLHRSVWYTFVPHTMHLSHWKPRNEFCVVAFRLSVMLGLPALWDRFKGSLFSWVFAWAGTGFWGLFMMTGLNGLTFGFSSFFIFPQITFVVPVSLDTAFSCVDSYKNIIVRRQHHKCLPFDKTNRDTHARAPSSNKHRNLMWGLCLNVCCISQRN